MQKEASSSTKPARRKFALGDKVYVNGITGECTYIRKAKTDPKANMCIVQLPCGRLASIAVKSISP